MQMTLSFAPLVEQVSDSVVNIYAKRVVESRAPLFRDPFFQRFFGNRLGPSRRRVENSLGSGVIVDSSGLIITNYHVIEGAREIQIGLRDGRTFAARILLRDQKLDLAILQSEGAPPDLQPAVLGRNEDLLVGDLVLAIGNPFGVGQTVTVGIVSGLARSGVGVSDFQSFIQTDAAINPGNSGGALVSMNGVVIGINTAIFSRSGGSQGIGFAVPSDIARLAVEAAREGREIRRPWLGFSGDKIERDVMEALGLEQAQGVIVADIHPQSAGQRIGLRKGDIILSVGSDDLAKGKALSDGLAKGKALSDGLAKGKALSDGLAKGKALSDGLAKGKALSDGLAKGKALADMEELRYHALLAGVDKILPLHILRKNKRLVLSFPLEEPPQIPPRNPVTIVNGPFKGAVIVNLSPAVIESLNLGTAALQKTGVAIESFKNRSQASRLGFKKGDIILSYNGQNVQTTDQLANLTRQDTRQKYQVIIERDGQQRRVNFR